MTAKSMKIPRAKISSTEFCNNRMTVGVIRRMGKSIVIVDGNGVLIPISRKSVEDLRETVIHNNRPSIRR